MITHGTLPLRAPLLRFSWRACIHELKMGCHHYFFIYHLLVKHLWSVALIIDQRCVAMGVMAGLSQPVRPVTSRLRACRRMKKWNISGFSDRSVSHRPEGQELPGNAIAPRRRDPDWADQRRLGVGRRQSAPIVWRTANSPPDR
jgi:hypothetical protein